MFDPAQIILLLAIVVLTIIFVALGVQVYFVLKEFRKTVDKTNKILDDISKITESVSNPISSFSSIITGLKTGGKIASLIKRIESFSRKEDNE